MIELAMLACLMDNPNRCRHVTLNFEGETVSASQCMTNGQIEMAKWAGDHPNWVIQKWTCRMAGTMADL